PFREEVFPLLLVGLGLRADRTSVLKEINEPSRGQNSSERHRPSLKAAHRHPVPLWPPSCDPVLHQNQPRPDLLTSLLADAGPQLRFRACKLPVLRTFATRIQTNPHHSAPELPAEPHVVSRRNPGCPVRESQHSGA